MDQSVLDESTKRIQTWSAGILPTSDRTSVSFSAISRFCSAERPSNHSIVTTGMRAARPRAAGSISCTSRFLGSAPTIWCATWPFLNSRIVGIDITL